MSVRGRQYAVTVTPCRLASSRRRGRRSWSRSTGMTGEMTCEYFSRRQQNVNSKATATAPRLQRKRRSLPAALGSGRRLLCRPRARVVPFPLQWRLLASCQEQGPLERNRTWGWRWWRSVVEKDPPSRGRRWVWGREGPVPCPAPERRRTGP